MRPRAPTAVVSAAMPSVTSDIAAKKCMSAPPSACHARPWARACIDTAPQAATSHAAPRRSCRIPATSRPLATRYNRIAMRTGIIREVSHSAPATCTGSDARGGSGHAGGKRDRGPVNLQARPPVSLRYGNRAVAFTGHRVALETGRPPCIGMEHNMASLVDRFGRSFPYLRLSLTEACNYRCSYCLPDGYQAEGRSRFLELDEVRRLVRGFAALGMSKIRLTGGEPTLRKDLLQIIGAVSAVPGIRRIAITTNGTLLPRHVGAWRDAGLTALNVSLDTLDPRRFHAITGHDRFAEVTEGVEMALGLGFDSVKLNAVLLRGRNDDELTAWFDYLRGRDIAIRFIELMRTGDILGFFERHHVRAEALEEQIVEAGWTLRPRAPDAGPAREYSHPDYRGRIGIIAPYSKDFCAGCNR